MRLGVLGQRNAQASSHSTIIEGKIIDHYINEVNTKQKSANNAQPTYIQYLTLDAVFSYSDSPATRGQGRYTSMNQ